MHFNKDHMMLFRSACAALFVALVSLPTAHAVEVTYDFSGTTSVGGSSHAYTGVFVYETEAIASTVYTPGVTAPVQEGFATTYAGAVRQLSITLDNGERVVGAPGNLAINNISQAESGSQLPQGLSAQAWTGGSTGTINGFQVFNLYLAFLPLPGSFSWDALDDYYGGNAEHLLQANPHLLPSDIDPALTGTTMPADLLVRFNAGVFLGTNHDLTNTVNDAGNFTLRPTMPPIPEPGSWLLMMAGLAAMIGVRRRVQTAAD
jgi:PEP-CTERM motif